MSVMSFVNVDRDTPMLLPLDLRDWVHDDDLVNFVLEAVEHVDLSRFHLKKNRSGKDQYGCDFKSCHSCGFF